MLCGQDHGVEVQAEVGVKMLLLHLVYPEGSHGPTSIVEKDVQLAPLLHRLVDDILDL